MWIEVCDDIFEKGDFKSLNYLYQILSWYPSNSIKRYNIFIDIEKIRDTQNYKKLKESEADFDLLIDTSFNDFITSSSSNDSKDYYITYKKSKTNFDIEEAIYFFNQTVSIILENNKNDSVFLTSIINNFGKSYGVNISQEHLKNNWIKYENAGGCSNMANFIEMYLKQFESIAVKNSRNVSDYFRGIIILDSDREYNNQPSKHDSLIKKIKKIGIDEKNIHILEKRMMENYMPDEVFIDLKSSLSSNPHKNKDLIDWISAYLHLQPNVSGINERKDFLNINKGKLKGSFSPTPGELDRLYNISATNFNILDKGFVYEGKDFKNKFPLFFLKSTLVNKHTLKKRSGTEEYNVIMAKINILL